MEELKPLMISGKKAREYYPTMNSEFKEMFEATFGKDFFSLKPTDRVKTVEDACEVLGIDPCTISHKNDKLETAIKALNFLANGNKIWIPDYNNINERKWYCWWWMNNPGFRLGDVFYTHSDSISGARLVFINEEIARYAAAQFLDLFKEYYLMPNILSEQVIRSSKSITDFRDINSFEIACSVKGYDPYKVLPDFSMYPEQHRAALTSVARLFIINEAVNYVDNGNKDWQPDYNDSDEEKHYHWVDMEIDANNPSGFRLCDVCYTYSGSFTGARLSYKSENGARHVFNHFEEDIRNFFVLK